MDSLPVNWFDLTVIILLVVGIMRGRKRGMSQEFLDVFKWLCVVFAAGLLYQPVGDLLPSNLFGHLTAYIIGYALVTMFILGIFMGIKRAIGGKLLGSDKFGNAEYPLGMISGMIRFACMLIAALAILNARYYTNKEIADALKYQNDNYGSQFFPDLQTVQAQVFKKSMSGPFIRDYMSLLLIKSTAPEKKKELRAGDYMP